MEELTLLSITAASIAFFHTLLGPDHYLPFTAMSRAGKWSISKTLTITALCGIGHVGSSVLLGLFGAGLGISLSRLEVVESFRGDLAAWCLLTFGLLYTVWGLRQAFRNKPHTHSHTHEDGTLHSHTHVHHKQHLHVHQKEDVSSLTPWILFTIFVFGPCEPLIPILMYPAAKISVFGMLLVTLVFTLVTISTMLGLVFVSSYGIERSPFFKLERFSHSLAGGTIFLCGAGILFLGL